MPHRGLHQFSAELRDTRRLLYLSVLLAAQGPNGRLDQVLADGSSRADRHVTEQSHAWTIPRGTGHGSGRLQRPTRLLRLAAWSAAGGRRYWRDGL